MYVGEKLQIDVSFSCVCPVIDHDFRHNIVKVAQCRSADYFDNVMTKFMRVGEAHEKLTSICFLQ